MYSYSYIYIFLANTHTQGIIMDLTCWLYMFYCWNGADSDYSCHSLEVKYLSFTNRFKEIKYIFLCVRSTFDFCFFISLFYTFTLFNKELDLII